METEKKCRDIVREAKQGRMDEIRQMWEAVHKNGATDAEREDAETTWSEYGLSFDYVPAGTFSGQRAGFFRFQISWGGPSEEIRFKAGPDFNLISADFWYLDWFDGARSRITGADLDAIREIWEDWRECEVPQTAFSQATEE